MSLDPIVTLLANHPFFSELPTETQRLIAFSGEPLLKASGQTLFKVDEAADAAYLVIEGEISLRMDESIRGLSERSVGAGYLLDGLCLLVDSRRKVTAVTKKDSKVLRISASLFNRLLNEFPEARARLARSLSRSLEETIASVEANLRELEASE